MCELPLFAVDKGAVAVDEEETVEEETVEEETVEEEMVEEECDKEEEVRAEGK